MSTTNAKHTLEHPVTLAPLYRSEYRDDMTKARDAKGRRVSTEVLVDGLAESRARIAELEASLAAVTAQRDQCREALDEANRGNKRLSDDLGAVRHAHIAVMAQRDRLTAHLSGVLDEADRYSDEMRRIGRGSMEFGSNAPGHSLSGMARAALRACDDKGGAL